MNKDYKLKALTVTAHVPYGQFKDWNGLPGFAYGCLMYVGSKRMYQNFGDGDKSDFKRVL
jgi:hypothetical protein